MTPRTPKPDSPRRFGTFRSAATAVGVSEPYVLVGLIFLALALGGVVHIFEPGQSGDLIWAAAIVLTLIPLTWSVLRTLMNGDVGVDAIALVAMVGALALGEYLAGAVIALMLSGVCPRGRRRPPRATRANGTARARSADRPPPRGLENRGSFGRED